MPSLPIAAMIAASVIATSSTGGNVAGPGVVVRTGDSYSSSNVTVVSSGEGSSTIDIRTNINGRVREEHREIPAGTNGARVEVSVTATSGPAEVEVHVAPPTATSTMSWFKKLFAWTTRPHAPIGTTTATSSAEVDIEANTPATPFARIGSWFRSFWGFFK